PAVRAEVNTSERDLFEAGRGDAVHFSKDTLERHAARSPPGRWNDAVRARLRAPCLHAQRECGATRGSRLYRRSTASLSLTKPFRRGESRRIQRTGEAANQLQQPRLVVVRNDTTHVGEST